MSINAAKHVSGIEVPDLVVESIRQTSSFTQFIGLVATVTTIAQFLSGTFTVKRVWLMGTPGDLSPVPFVAGVLGCSLWFLYGAILKDPTIIYTNVAGVILNIFYVGIFFLYTSSKILMSRQIFIVIISIFSVAYYISSFEANEQIRARNELGLICTIVSLSCCASPLISLKHVIRTKSTDSLPFPLILSVFFVCLLWWTYGILIDDFYMKMTNCLGTIISSLQLLLFFIYPSSSPIAPHNYQKVSST